MTRTITTAIAIAAFLAMPGTGTDRALAQRDAPTRTAAAKAQDKPKKVKVHKLAIQVAENRPEIMNLALNNAKNVIEHYKKLGEKVDVVVVAFGPGLHMLRDDTSPVKQRIAEMELAESAITFEACSNTRANQARQEQKPITLVAEAVEVPSGVVRLMELQRKGYAYLRP